MSHSIVSQLAAKWFVEYSRLAYWLGRRWSRRLLDYRGRRYSSDELEELAQDAVCRGYDRLVKRCQREVCGQSDREHKRWVCQTSPWSARTSSAARRRVSGFQCHLRLVALERTVSKVNFTTSIAGEWQ